jgi:hypothetical protein
MTTKDLVGFQIVSIDDSKVVVRKDNKTYELLIKEYDCGCCGYNVLETKLLISDDELNKNPIITRVERKCHEGDHDGECCKITFFGSSKPLASIDSESNSGSGWCYGASVSLVCKALELDETLTSL